MNFGQDSSKNLPEAPQPALPGVQEELLQLSKEEKRPLSWRRCSNLLVFVYLCNFVFAVLARAVIVLSSYRTPYEFEFYLKPLLVLFVISSPIILLICIYERRILAGLPAICGTALLVSLLTWLPSFFLASDTLIGLATLFLGIPAAVLALGKQVHSARNRIHVLGCKDHRTPTKTHFT